ncbi:MAG TPA: undecaprenyl-diphosphate phosphatase [Myxococcota bacterium]|nr:undecaprenyl-diphosphate phosphatase [Myxococcota bacterium]HQK52026.1 undecaprenyl-diphosphate phosphatase [Myxococcota bacterium]
MNGIEAIILGLVEGFTEFLPVSSTGHLVLAQRALGMPGNEANDTFAVIIQGGAILAVLGLYWGRFMAMARGLLGQDRNGLVTFRNLVVAFLPAVPAGTMASLVKEHLFRLDVVVAAWAAGGLLLIWLHRRRRGMPPDQGRTIETLSWQGALLIGLCQVASIFWPGTSRSLMALVGGLLAGLSLMAAVEFSFLLGFVTLLAAVAYSALQVGTAMVRDLGTFHVFLAFLVAALSAAVSVRFLVGTLNRHGLGPFGWYRLALAAVTGILMWNGILVP